MDASSLVPDASSVAARLAIPAPSASLRGVVGADFARARNLHVLSGGEGASAGDAPVILTIAGNAVRVHDLTSGAMRYVPGRDGGGIAALSVHPSRRLFAVAERRWTGGAGPRIYIYEYPSLRLLRVLEGGTERAYTDVGFEPVADADAAAVHTRTSAAPAAAAASASSVEGETVPSSAVGGERKGEGGGEVDAAGAVGGSASAQSARASEGGVSSAHEGGADAAAGGGNGATAAGSADELATLLDRFGGRRLVTVGGFPDFSLIIWDLVAARPLLRTKAFAQEVFNAKFSPTDSGKSACKSAAWARP